MAKRVTIQDIADELGVSRNTVSKAINNTGVLAEATKKRILQKAIEMGYKTFSYTSSPLNPNAAASYGVFSSIGASSQRSEIAIFTGMFLDNAHFASTMLDKFQHELSLLGYSMTLHRVMQENLDNLTLPLSFHPDNTAAVICLELFHHPYCKMLCDMNFPLLLVDGPIATYASPLPADLLLMENTSAIHQIVKNAARKGITKIGFVGEALHCRSFFERFMAFREAMYLYSIPVNEEYCLTNIHPHGTEYRDYLKSHISKMKELPQLFICANDFIAFDLIIILRGLGISCPDDILLCGFDDSPGSKIVMPTLTTCHIHSQTMGLSAVHLILTRIKQPDLNYRIIHTETDLIYRESTRGEFEIA